ncbi:hypothetical protein D3C73_1173770 [compost metagenome]
MLPVEQEAHEILQGHGLDFPAQALDGVAMNPRQQMSLAPLFFGIAWGEAPAQHIAFAFQVRQCLGDFQSGQFERGGNRLHRQWTKGAEPRSNHFYDGVVRRPGQIETRQSLQGWRQIRLWINRLQARQPFQRQPQ